MQEIISLRQENSKTFRVDGARQWQGSIGAIHYKNNYASDEGWKDIDLTWEGRRIVKAPYELTRNGNRCTLRNKKTGEVSSIELLESRPLGLKFEVIPEFSAVRFRHTLPSDKVPFEARFKVAGKIPFRTRAFDDEGELELETSLKDGILSEKLSSVADRETKAIRPVKGNIRIDPTYQVGESTDDAHRRLTTSSWALTLSDHRAGAYSTAYYQYGGGMRFQEVAIAQGTTINTAYITFTSTSSGYTGTEANTRISAEDVDDAVTFADDKDVFDTRWAARTTARVDWDAIASWTANTEYDSPEIKTVIQEIVDRGSWVSGNDIVLFWDDFEDRSTHDDENYNQRSAYSYDGSTTKCAQLVVTFSTAYVRTLSTAIGLTASLSRSQGHVRSLTTDLRLDTTLTRAIAYTRALTTNVRLSPTITRAVAYTRSLTSTAIGLSATITRAVACARSLTTNIRLSTPSITRVIEYIRSLTATITLRTWMTWGGKLKRQLKTVGTNRTLAEVGTNREVSEVGTNRDVESW